LNEIWRGGIAAIEKTTGKGGPKQFYSLGYRLSNPEKRLCAVACKNARKTGRFFSAAIKKEHV
jgi:hypothetical protein